MKNSLVKIVVFLVFVIGWAGAFYACDDADTDEAGTNDSDSDSDGDSDGDSDADDLVGSCEHDMTTTGQTFKVCTEYFGGEVDTAKSTCEALPNGVFYEGRECSTAGLTGKCSMEQAEGKTIAYFYNAADYVSILKPLCEGGGGAWK